MKHMFSGLLVVSFALVFGSAGCAVGGEVGDETAGEQVESEDQALAKKDPRLNTCLLTCNGGYGDCVIGCNGIGSCKSVCIDGYYDCYGYCYDLYL